MLQKDSQKFPLYKYDLYRDGLTQSAIALWMTCREQFRLGYIEGWMGQGFSEPLVYGDCAHCVIESCLKSNKFDIKDIHTHIEEYRLRWLRDQSGARVPAVIQSALEVTMSKARATLPSYFRLAASSKNKHYNDFKRKWVSVEGEFSESINGVPLRGKIDGVFEANEKNWLLETKNLSVIDEDSIADTLETNFQANLYLWALAQKPNIKVGGVLYNVLRRPGLRLGKNESLKEYEERITSDINERPDHYFKRFEAPMGLAEVKRFEEHTLRPIVTEIKSWWERLNDDAGDRANPQLEFAPRHFVNPWGLKGLYGKSPYFGIITQGRTNGFVRKPRPFMELEYVPSDKPDTKPVRKFKQKSH